MPRFSVQVALRLVVPAALAWTGAAARPAGAAQQPLAPARRGAVLVPRDTTPRDTTPAARADTLRGPRPSTGGPDSTPHHAGLRGPRVPLTSALAATAYADARARSLVARARAARLSQDSMLASYDAIARQRLTVGLAIRRAGRERVFLRGESASRVRWQRGLGALVDLLGTRTIMPMLFSGVRALPDMLDLSPIPYYPGRESLLRFTGVERTTDLDGSFFVHPLAAGAEAYYTYRGGGTMRFRLATGDVVRLAQVLVQPRAARPDLIAGSLWFDEASGQLVRAAYRPAAPLDIWRVIQDEEPGDAREMPRPVRALLTPMVLSLRAFTVEYALHEGRWWLPRLESAEGTLRAGALRASASVVQRFDYSRVTGDSRAGDGAAARAAAGEGDGAPMLTELPAARTPPATARARSEGGTLDDDPDLEQPRCAPGDTIVRRGSAAEGAVPVATRIPCDARALVQSPSLPGSIYAAGDSLFGGAERDALVRELGPVLRRWEPERPAISWGLARGLLRYNRVEGLSAGVMLEQRLGPALASSAVARLETAELQPNAELRLRREGVRGAIELGVYRRLAAAGDWGDPFSLGSSVLALVFGRDEGFYYRAWGAELVGPLRAGSGITWRLFAEREGPARVETQLSLAHALNGLRFRPNIDAARATEMGLALRALEQFGLDPRWPRATVDARLEGATGGYDYVRGMLDVTLVQRLGSRSDVALTLGAGTSGGTLPAQRRWYLGGAQTVRGQPPGAAAGDAYWLGRLELARTFSALRPAIFGDLGWAGDRADWTRPGRTLAGAGVGLSVLEGLIRLDLAKGLAPTRGVRMDLTLDARF